MNQPRKHHYVPAFYLARWAQSNGKLCQWSKPYKSVVPRMVYPAATCYVDGLYALKDLPPEEAQQVESRFFSPMDDRAAKVLEFFEQHGRQPEWNSNNRSAWTRFILTILRRSPDDIEAYRQLWPILLRNVPQNLEAQYQAAREPEDPDTFSDFMTSLPTSDQEADLYDVYMAIDGKGQLGNVINRMHWEFLKIENEDFYFYTSDEPVIRINMPGGPLTAILLPIGPHCIFIAASTRDVLRNIVTQPARKLIKECNKKVVTTARRYAFSLDDLPRRFFENNFSTIRELRLLEKILLRRSSDS